MTRTLADTPAGRASGQAFARWTAGQVRAIAMGPRQRIPLLGASAREPLLPGLWLWDQWPLAMPDGATAEVAGGALAFALSAPAGADPDARHDVARIRALWRPPGGGWRDLGAALPEGLAPGGREWSGSAVLMGPDRVRLFFTAAGRRGEPVSTFEQRLFQADAHLGIVDGAPRLSGWTTPAESVPADGAVFADTATAPTAPGRIKAWRDPAFFRDPKDGFDYLVFAASLADARDGYDGAIAIARAADVAGERWTLLPPLLDASGVNREVERPHVVLRDGRYYLFWCTQARMFAPGLCGPTGLYGMVGETLFGPYRPLNGGGLVLGNPPAAPRQTYAWWVDGEGVAGAFVDHVGPDDAAAPAAGDAARFGGAPAPDLQLTFDDDRVLLA